MADLQKRLREQSILIQSVSMELTLKEAADALDAKDAEIARLERKLQSIKYWHDDDGTVQAVIDAARHTVNYNPANTESLRKALKELDNA